MLEHIAEFFGVAEKKRSLVDRLADHVAEFAEDQSHISCPSEAMARLYTACLKTSEGSLDNIKTMSLLHMYANHVLYTSKSDFDELEREVHPIAVIRKAVVKASQGKYEARA